MNWMAINDNGNLVHEASTWAEWRKMIRDLAEWHQTTPRWFFREPAVLAQPNRVMSFVVRLDDDFCATGSPLSTVVFG